MDGWLGLTHRLDLGVFFSHRDGLEVERETQGLLHTTGHTFPWGKPDGTARGNMTERLRKGWGRWDGCYVSERDRCAH